MKKISVLFYVCFLMLAFACTPDREAELANSGASKIRCLGIAVSNAMPISQPVVVFEGDQIEWFNETSGEIYFKSPDRIVSALKMCKGVTIWVNNENIFSLVSIVTNDETQMINHPVFYYDSDFEKFYIAKYLLSHVETAPISPDFDTIANKNWQAIQPGWQKFIKQLKKEGKYDSVWM